MAGARSVKGTTSPHGHGAPTSCHTFTALSNLSIGALACSGIGDLSRCEQRGLLAGLLSKKCWLTHSSQLRLSLSSAFQPSTVVQWLPHYVLQLPGPVHLAGPQLPACCPDAGPGSIRLLDLVFIRLASMPLPGLATSHAGDAQ